MGGVKRNNGCTTQAAPKQHAFSQPYRTDGLGVTGKNGGSKLGWGEGRRRALEAKESTLRLEDRGERVTREEVGAVELGGMGAGGAGVVNLYLCFLTALVHKGS